jgi:hypothetical protein
MIRLHSGINNGIRWKNRLPLFDPLAGQAPTMEKNRLIIRADHLNDGRSLQADMTVVAEGRYITKVTDILCSCVFRGIASPTDAAGLVTHRNARILGIQHCPGTLAMGLNENPVLPLCPDTGIKAAVMTSTFNI